MARGDFGCTVLALDWLYGALRFRREPFDVCEVGGELQPVAFHAGAGIGQGQGDESIGGLAHDAAEYPHSVPTAESPFAGRLPCDRS